jgi:hypothetical protein
LVRSVSRLVVLVGMLVVLGGSAGPASAEVDQSQTGISQGVSTVGPTQSVAQTFTAGITGDLDRVDLYLSQGDVAATAPLTVEIRAVDASGEPTGPPLASASVPAASVPSIPGGWVTVLFAPPAPVVAGTQYAIVVYTASSNSYLWYGQAANPYPAGAAWFSTSPPSTWSGPSSADQAFITYVTPTYDLPVVVQSLALSGSSVRFRLATPATVRFSLDRRISRNRYRRVGTFSARARRGRNRVRIPRRLNGRRIGKGVFRLSARAVNSSGRGALTRRVVRLR